ncbi:terpenoid synthase [Agrocybe pediades]|nr:terpenoid synthase [Agrocybe pediades]
MSSNRSFQLPDLLSIVKPLELRTNRHCRAVTDASEKWFTGTLKEQGELTETELSYLRPMKAGLLCSLCFPTCDAPQLRILTDLTTLLLYSGFRDYSFNDCRTDRRFSWNFQSSLGKSSSTKIFKVHTDGFEMLNGHALLKHIVKQCTTNVTAKTPEPWSHRFEEAVKDFRHSQEQVLLQKTQNIVPSIEEFIEIRREMQGGSLTWSIAELLEVFEYPELPGPDAESVSSLTRHAIDIISWSMDVVSYQSDQTRGKTHNLVAVLMAQKNLSVQGAINLAGNMIRESVAAFFATERAILESMNPQKPTNGRVFSWIKSFFTGSTQTEPMSNEEAKAKQVVVERYIQVLKDSIIGVTHWLYETELFFGKKGAEIRTFGWVFIDEVPIIPT